MPPTCPAVARAEAEHDLAPGSDAAVFGVRRDRLRHAAPRRRARSSAARRAGVPVACRRRLSARLGHVPRLRLSLAVPWLWNWGPALLQMAAIFVLSNQPRLPSLPGGL